MLDLKKKYLKLLVKQEVVGQKFSNKLSQLNDFYLPICDKLFNDFKTLRRTFIIGLSGGQGSGKSTIGYLLSKKLALKFIDIDREIEKETNEIILDGKTIEAARKSVIRMTEIGR